MLFLIKTLNLLFFLSVFHSSSSAPADENHQVSHIERSPKKPYSASLAGSLEMPSEGAHFVNQGGAMGNIQIIYRCPNSYAVTEVGERTVSIDVVLVPMKEAGYKPGPQEVVLARGLRARIGENGERIQTNFVPPATVCGDYRMVVTENQIFNNAVVQLASGSPTVSILCRKLEEF